MGRALAHRLYRLSGSRVWTLRRVALRLLALLAVLSAPCVYAGTTATLQVAVSLSLPRTTIYVNFLHFGPENGTEQYPYNTLAEAVAAVEAGGTIDIVSGDSAETLRITKAMTLRAIGGTVILGAGSSRVMLGGDAAPQTLDMARIMEHWRQLSGTTDSDAPGSSAAGVIQTGFVYESVFPSAFTGRGVYLADPGDVLAIRLRNETSIDTETLRVPVTSQRTPWVISEWMPVEEGDLRDLWILITPQDAWQLGDALEINVTAATQSGEMLPPVQRSFLVGVQAGIPSVTASLSLAESLLGAELPQAVTPPLKILPDQVFSPPQRLWIPVPDEASAQDLRIYYHHPNGDAPGWYPADHVIGWAEPGSLVHLRTLQGEYLGLLINHAGTVQVAPAIPGSP